MDERLEKSQREIERSVGELQDIARGVGPYSQIADSSKNYAADAIEAAIDHMKNRAREVREHYNIPEPKKG